MFPEETNRFWQVWRLLLTYRVEVFFRHATRMEMDSWAIGRRWNYEINWMHRRVSVRMVNMLEDGIYHSIDEENVYRVRVRVYVLSLRFLPSSMVTEHRERLRMFQLRRAMRSGRMSRHYNPGGVRREEREEPSPSPPSSQQFHYRRVSQSVTPVPGVELSDEESPQEERRGNIPARLIASEIVRGFGRRVGRRVRRWSMNVLRRVQVVFRR